MARLKNLSFSSLLILALTILFWAPSSFFTANTMSHLMDRISILSLLVCGFSFLLLLGRLDLSASSILLSLTFFLRTADSHWGWSAPTLTLICFSFTMGMALWHHYWIDYRHIPSSFITGITGIVLWSITYHFAPLKKLDPQSLFFYALAFNPLSPVAIYFLITSLLFGFFIIYYLRLSSRLQYNLRSDQWIPFMILVLTGSSLGLTGLIRLHTYMQFRILFFSAFLAIGIFWVIERFSRTGRRIRTIGLNPQMAFLAGIPVGKVRRNVWILTGLLLGILSLFYRSFETMIEPLPSIRLQGLLLGAGLLGGLSPPHQRVRIPYSLLSVVFFVTLDTLLDHWRISPLTSSLLITLLLFAILLASGFKEGKLT